MIKQILVNVLIALGIGYLCQILQSICQSQFLLTFLKGNLITLLIALLAINSATMGIVLTKIRELIDKAGTGSEVFQSTKDEMLLSIKEQIALVVVSVILLTVLDSELAKKASELQDIYPVLLFSIFAYSIINLYDTAKSVLIIIDYD
ncbi:hypothetical protein GIJ78_06085 [Escherichia coli]|nr:hypothetical protein [Pseudomonas sp. Marseille-Q3773]MRF40095.1 hypothetical protein [Escherichia coli]